MATPFGERVVVSKNWPRSPYVFIIFLLPRALLTHIFLCIYAHLIAHDIFVTSRMTPRLLSLSSNCGLDTGSWKCFSFMLPLSKKKTEQKSA